MTYGITPYSLVVLLKQASQPMFFVNPILWIVALVPVFDDIRVETDSHLFGGGRSFAF
jgi:hypothetical protein